MISQNRAMTIGGWVVTVLMGLMLIGLSARMKLIKDPQAVEGMQKFGYPDNTMFPIGVTEAACTVLYLIPQTATLGAVFLTGYLGGATATHVRVSDAFYMPVIIGALVWLGLWLRDPRLRSLLPLRLPPRTDTA